MSTNYTSFLICDHGDHQDVFCEGLPVGVMRDGQFEPHIRHYTTGDVPVTMKDFPKLNLYTIEKIVQAAQNALETP